MVHKTSLGDDAIARIQLRLYAICSLLTVLDQVESWITGSSSVIVELGSRTGTKSRYQGEERIEHAPPVQIPRQVFPRRRFRRTHSGSNSGKKTFRSNALTRCIDPVNNCPPSRPKGMRKYAAMPPAKMIKWK